MISSCRFLACGQVMRSSRGDRRPAVRLPMPIGQVIGAHRCPAPTRSRRAGRSGAALAVELVDEGQDRRVAHAADVQQLDGLRLDAVPPSRSPSPPNRPRSACGRCLPEKSSWPGRVEQVDHAFAVGELHHRRGDRDAALLSSSIQSEVAWREALRRGLRRRPPGWRRRSSFSVRVVLPASGREMMAKVRRRNLLSRAVTAENLGEERGIKGARLYPFP